MAEESFNKNIKDSKKLKKLLPKYGTIEFHDSGNELGKDIAESV